MAEYEFECRDCLKTFTIFLRVTDRMKTIVRCPGCDGTNVEALMQPFVARTGKKS